MHLSKISLALRQWGAGAGFSPLDLFSSGEQGAWYDPSDLSTMFQDSAGTTPVTADGQPVGLVLDKSKGLVLGSEMITVTANRDFSSDTGFWVKGTGASISGGKANFSSASGWSLYRTSFGVSAGNLYEVSLTISGYSAGTIKVACGSTPGYSATFAANGTYTVRLGPIAGGDFGFVTSSFTGSIDDISVKAVSGNHASQATAASRPLYKTDGTYHWLQFDGVDDSLSTAAINFTGTDKMSVFAGFVTTDNVGFDGIIQLGSVASGGFWSYSNTANLEFKVQGSSGVSAVNSVYTPASRSVLTSLMNLGGATGQNCLSTRKNASLFANASVVSGAANFQNGQLFIGGNVVGTWMSGNIYSLIVRGALSTTDEITATETWVNQRTGAY